MPLRGNAAKGKSQRSKGLHFEPLERRLLLDGNSPIISELLAVNATTRTRPLGEEDDFSDWIEIHNPTDTAIELDGWYLTDEEGDRTKWRFPDIQTPGADVVLEPGDYLIVYASGLDQGGPADELHTSFQLNGNGEYLALVEPDGVTVAHQFYPEFPQQREDFSYGITQHVTTFVPEGAEAGYHVPTSSDTGTDWTQRGFDDSGWVHALGTGLSGLKITEIDNRDTDWIEIQNVWDREIDTSGWLVAVNDGLSGNVNAVNPVVWSLPATIPAGQVLYKTDSGDNYWGSDIGWDSNHGWAMIVDDQGRVADFLPWGYTEAEIQSLDVNIGPFSNITLGSQWSGGAPMGMTNGWQTGNPGTDIGDPAYAGSYTYDGGSDTYTVNGGGHDIWDPPYYDEFYYVYQPLSGDTEVIAKVLSVENTNGWAKAGVMIRETLTDTSKHAMVVLTPQNGVAFQGRTATGGSSYNTQQQGFSAPRWVRLVREGNEFRGYHSADGVNWEYLGAQTIQMATTLHVGLAVTSHNDSTLCTAEFQNVAVGTPAPPEMLERIGNLDRNTAADFVVPATQSRGTQNADLVLPFPGSQDVPVRTGIGFNVAPSGFDVTMYKASGLVESLSGAEAVIVDPAQQTWVEHEIAEVVNYYNTGNEGHYSGNSPFPGTVINTDVNDFVVEITATVLIPAAGQWTFGVNSDDGFGLELTNGADTFSSSFPGQRGPADTLATFNVVTPGAYDLRLVMFDRGGGAEVELFAARGSHAAFNAVDFALVGDMDGGGLLVTGFGGAIQTDVVDAMRNVNASLWTRIPFQADDPSTLDSLRLRMKYNDGFVAYINGQEVARRNAPPTPQWNSEATDSRSYEESVVFEEINVTAFIGSLEVGDNVLAIHGLNVAAADDNFLILPMLVGSHTGTVERYFSEPTPGDPNGPGFIDFVADTRFSVDRGFYEDPFPLEIVTNTSGATIRYTVDGSEPTESNGFTYTDPLTIEDTTTLRAAAFKLDHYPTNIDTQSYIFLDDVVTQSPSEAPPGWPTGSLNGQTFLYGMDTGVLNEWGVAAVKQGLESIPSMSLVTDLDNLVDAGSGIYVNAGSHGRDWERPTSLELIYPPDAQGPGFPDGADDGFQVEAGLRIRGGFSRSGGNPKHAFRLFFRREYGDPKLNYPLFGYEGVDSFDKVDLRTAQNYSWSYQNDGSNTMCRDVWARDTQGELGHAYTRSRYYHLYINGQYWGIYQTQERPEAAFGASYFGGDREDWDCVKATGPNAGYGIEATDGNLDAWEDLWELSNQVAAVPTELERAALYHQMQGQNPDGTRNPAYPVLLDADNLIDYMLQVFYDGDRDAPISNFLGNTRTNNWYGIRNRNGDEGFRFFVHDAEHIMSRGLSDRTGPYPCGDQFFYSNPQWIHQQLINHEEYRLRVADRAYKHLYNDGALTAAAAIERFQARADQIDMAIIAESARWGTTWLDKNTWQNALNNEINNFFPNRSQTVFGQVDTNVFPPSLNQHGGQVEQGFEATMGAPGGTIYYTLDGTDPRLPGGDVSPTAEIYQGSTTVEDLVLIDDQWAYEQTDTDLGTAWREKSYGDSSWPRGDALLYHEGSSLPAPKNTPLNLGPTTYYFRRHFNLNGDPQNTQLQMRTVLDDGAVFYINGQEVYRLGIQAGAINHNTFANRSVGDAVFEGPFTLPTDALLQGDNVIAVEVHQVNAGSSDVVFGLELEAAVQTSTTPITLSETTLLKARAKEGSQWSAVCEAQFFVEHPATAENTLITELNYQPYDPTAEELAVDPAFLSDDFEFLELRNVSDYAVALAGVAFIDGIDFDFDTVSVDPLAPGESIVVARNVAAFQARYGTQINVTGGYDSKLANEGEQIELRDFFGEPIARFTYNGPGNWPDRAKGKGASLELIDPDAVPTTDPARSEFLDDDDNWRSSSEYGGSPGVLGSGPLGDVVVNEVLTHTDPPDQDSIELHNLTGGEIYLGGWYLSDSWGWESSEENGNYKKFRIPDGTSIPPHGYVVFKEDDFNPTWNDPQPDPAPNHFALNGAHGDDVWLMEPDGAGRLKRFVDHVDFGAAARGESWGRWPNGTGELYPMLSPTFDPQDGDNSGPRVGPVIFSEVHYNPEDPDEDATLEFIEIYNGSPQTVDLTEWRIRGGVEYDFPAGYLLDPYQELVILPFELSDADKWAAFCVAYGLDPAETDGFLGPLSGRLSDEGERFELQRPDTPDEFGFIPRLLEDQVRYDDELPWPVEADGGGDSLNRTQTDAWGNTYQSWDPLLPSPGETTFIVPQGEVVGRYVFYNGSTFDGNSTAADDRDDDAIAPDKAALLPGQTATFANYTSYSRGINGIMVDIDGMPEGAQPGLDDFRFRMGNSYAPASWGPAPTPSLITVRPGEGVDGSDRVTIIWDDNLIQKQWLQVTVLTTNTTRLAAEDVFYFGNAIGDSGNSATDAKVNAFDMLGARDNQRTFITPASIDFAYDFNRDARVNTYDMLIARDNQTHFLNALKLITVPPAKATAEDPAKTAEVSAYDAVLEQAVGRQSPRSEGFSARLTWLYEFEQTDVPRRPSRESDSAEGAVDALLADD